MLFASHARITLTHEGDDPFGLVAYRILYKLHDVAADAPRFHAQYRHTVTDRDHPVCTVLDGVRARAAMWTPVWPGRHCNPAGGARAR